jgi:hypothetical protein
METATVIHRTSFDPGVMKGASRIARAHEYFDYTGILGEILVISDT